MAASSGVAAAGIATGAASTGIGAIVGGAVALIAGITVGASKVREGKVANEYYSEQTKKQVLNYVSNVAAYTEALRANKQEGTPINYQYLSYSMPTLNEWISAKTAEEKAKTEEKLARLTGEGLSSTEKKLQDIVKEDIRKGSYGEDPRRKLTSNVNRRR